MKSEFEKALIRAARVLAKKKIGPLSLSQTLHMPLGPLYVVTVGDIDRGILPSKKNLIDVKKEINRQAKDLFKRQRYEILIFPPILSISEIFLEQGTLYLFKLGDLGYNIIPTLKDLDSLRKLILPVFKRLGVKLPAALFYPPILSVVLTNGKKDGLDCTLGSLSHNIIPSVKQVRECRRVVSKAAGVLGIKRKDVRVESAGYKNFK